MGAPPVVVYSNFTVIHSLLWLSTYNPIVIIHTHCVRPSIDINVFYSKLPYITKALVKLNTADKDISQSKKGLHIIEIR